MTPIEQIRRFIYLCPISPERSEAVAAVEQLESAFDEQSRAFGIALGFLQPDQQKEFQHRAYPDRFPR